MPIETVCQGCGRRLRVGDEHAGRKARCPQCGIIYTVPESNASPGEQVTTVGSDAGAVSAEADRWQLRIPDGRIYGPVPKSELDQWLREGRITGECHLLREGSQVWRPASEVYPHLHAGESGGQPVQARATEENPFAGDAPYGAQSRQDSPYAPSHVTRPSARYSLPPHRGALILILGILGWVTTCFVFAPFAWAMGSADVRAMREGRMDPSGMGLTQAGMILGMIQTILALLGLALFILMAVAG